MDGAKLQDRLNRGMGLAARRTGLPYIVYRPHGPAKPITSLNRVIRLQAAFSVGRSSQGNLGYSGALWCGIFDRVYTRAGDYLTGDDATFFVAAQMQMRPTQCVLTNRIVSIFRPRTPAGGTYSGMVAENAEIVISDWPARLSAMHSHAAGGQRDARAGIWQVLLPKMSKQPQPGNIVVDDIGNTFSILLAEAGDFGWRLLTQQIV